MRRISDTLARIAALQKAGPFAAAPPSRLVALDSFGSNPGALSAFCHVPAGLKPGAPLVVVLHGCTQTAAGYDLGTGWSVLADRAGFAVLFAEQRRANNPNLCFTWFEPADTARLGGEAQSIAQMTEAMIVAHGLDRSRVFVTGLSAGGAMTAVMLATYPDVFAAGAIIAGLPYGSAATVAQALDRMRGVGHASAADAARAVRSAGPGGERLPAVSIWHGTADTTVVPGNAAASVAQWRIVHDLPPAATETVRGERWEHCVWRDRAGRVAIEQWRVIGVGHGVPIDPSGPDGLGQAGPYMLDVGVASTVAIAAGWGLVAATAPAQAPDARVAPPATPFSDVQDAIERALRSAGLVR